MFFVWLAQEASRERFFVTFKHFHEVCKPSKVPRLSVKTGVRPCSLWIVVNGVQDVEFHPDSRRFPSGMESRGRNFVRNEVKVMEFRPEWSPQSSGKSSLGLEVLVWGWKSLGMTSWRLEVPGNDLKSPDPREPLL